MLRSKHRMRMGMRICSFKSSGMLTNSGSAQRAWIDPAPDRHGLACEAFHAYSSLPSRVRARVWLNHRRKCLTCLTLPHPSFVFKGLAG